MFGRKKTQSRKRKSVVYSLYESRGERTYVGTTNNPKRRKSEHRKSGKLSSEGIFKVESRGMGRSSAEKLEAKKLRGYKKRTGKLPKHNKTSDGQFH